ncbi:MAG TPA: sugar phosphate isomerase/epimerase, partial [Bacillales bacterium]|nr:sugar phosphate isomerase/epimerase [Bacillales bacterium]
MNQGGIGHWKAVRRLANKIGMRLPPRIGKQPVDAIAEWAVETGLGVLDVHRLTPEIKETSDKHHLEIGTVDAVRMGELLSKDEKVRSDAAVAVQQQIKEIAELGGGVLFMCLVPPDLSQPRSESFAIWKETFPEIVETAERDAVSIAIEGWPGPAPQYPTIGCTPEMWRAMFEAVPSKRFGLNYDPSHLVRLGIDYLRVLEEFGDRIVYCHGKDTELLSEELYEFGTLPATFKAHYGFSEGSWRYTVPGEGTVDWKKVALRLERIGYGGPVSIELEDHRY